MATENLWRPDPDAVVGPESSAAMPALKFANLRILHMEKGRADLVIDPILPEHRGGSTSEAVNGALIAYLLDVVMGAACESLYLGAPRLKHRTATTNLTVNYVAPVYGNVCRAEAEVLGGGRSVLHTRADVKDENDDVCVYGTGTYRIWPGGPMVHPLPGPPRREFRPMA
ncbi:MAG TPA: PaaI family thioesterase [Egibacteraceae bacterium]